MRLLERCDLGSIRVDRENSVIRGVKILGLKSRNGRTYSADALQRAVPMYEGARVNVDHPARQGVRSYRDQLGVLQRVRFERGALWGDLRVNPKHPCGEQLLWDAENSPMAVGLSHNADGRTVQRNGATIVEEITRVHSVDVVTQPASVAGLFEADTGGADVAWTLFIGKAKEVYDSSADPSAKAKAIQRLAKVLFGISDELAAITGEAAPRDTGDSTVTPESLAQRIGQRDDARRFMEAEHFANQLARREGRAQIRYLTPAQFSRLVGD